MQGRRSVGFSAACLLALVACSSSTKASDNAATAGPAVKAGEPFPADRCTANRAAGPITYISGYDFAASASIIDVLVAEQRGYFDAVCLDVRVQAGIASDNYQKVTANTAQFSSGGSFSELVAASLDGDGGLVALAVEGKESIDTVIVKPGRAAILTDLRGATIGLKNTLPASVRAMFAKAGLTEGTDFRTTVLDSFDPVQNLATPGVTGFTGFASNEPGQLDRAGVPYTTFSPAGQGIPGSFGVLYTNRTFVAQHPTAAADFMRATMQGLADAVADPASASMVAIDFIDNNGNPNKLSSDGEAFRWQTESKLVVDSTPRNEPLGLPDTTLLQHELDVYSAVGVFAADPPKASRLADPSVLRSLYDSNDTVIWPGGGT